MKAPVLISRQTGVTLIELIISIVVIGIALAALISNLSSGIARSANPLLEQQALALSQAYLNEITAMAFDDQTPVGGGQVSSSQNPCVQSNEGQSRENFDDVDDYHGLVEQPPQLIETSLDLIRLQEYSVSISVNCAGSDLGVANEYAKRILVSIRLPGGDVRSASSYKGNF